MSQQNNLPEETQLECSNCQQSYEQVLALKCAHNLCMQCAIKNIIQVPRANLQSVTCEICSQTTPIEPEAQQILQQLVEEHLQQQEQYDKSKRVSALNVEENIGTQKQSAHCMKDSQLKQSLNLNQNQSYSRYAKKSMVNYNEQCKDHPGEDQILYCFTCETPCICMECYLNGLHKNHNVKNIRKNYNLLAPHIEDLRFKLKANNDLLLNEECRLTQKKRELSEVVAQSKTQIQQNFRELIEVIEQKQTELLMQTEDLMRDKFQEIDACVSQIKEQISVLQLFDEGLSQSFYREQEQRSLQSEIYAYNYYSDNKQRILQTIDTMQKNYYYPIKNKLLYEFALDMQSLYQHVEGIRTVKIEVIALKGLESMLPSRAEEQIFKQAKENLATKKCQDFLNRSQIHQPKPEENAAEPISDENAPEQPAQEVRNPREFSLQQKQRSLMQNIINQDNLVQPTQKKYSLNKISPIRQLEQDLQKQFRGTDSQPAQEKENLKKKGTESKISDRINKLKQQIGFN